MNLPTSSLSLKESPMVTRLAPGLGTEGYVSKTKGITWSMSLSQVLVTPLFFHWSSLLWGLLFWYLSSICFRKRLGVNYSRRGQHKREG